MCTRLRDDFATSLIYEWENGPDQKVEIDPRQRSIKNSSPLLDLGGRTLHDSSKG